MLKLLFWNTYRKSLHEQILELKEEKNANIIALVENVGDDNNFLSGLENVSFKKATGNINHNRKIFYNSDFFNIKTIHEHGRYTIFELNYFKKNIKIILALVHFPSKLHADDDAYFSYCVSLRNNIEKKENELDTRNTVIVGDFNMNPFESGFLNATGISCTGIKSVALKYAERTISGEKFRCFYNPAWSHLGDSSRGNVPGTYYYNSSQFNNLYWNMFDQVIIRPDLLRFFDDDNFEIITSIKGRSLLKDNNGVQTIDKKNSDHLPLFFQLKSNSNE
ncbi:hypothetical protein [Lewinella sp. LCG006]|uniref:hypothetical protein n=1 Tax=Lewinella sp. LCG006 TaxID=3231911 RepID=UPI00345F2B9F